MDSTDFTTALTKAQQAGIGKDEFLRIWDMEAQLRLVRQQANRCGQQEGKSQSSLGFTEGKINDAIEGNHSKLENSTQEVRTSPDLLKDKEKPEDLTKNLLCLGRDTENNVSNAVPLQTSKLKEDFDQVRKELAEEMHQLKEEVKSLKDNILSERCQGNGHDKLCSEINEQKQELAGLREDVRQWRKEFVELKEILLTMSGKLEEATKAKEIGESLKAAVCQETSSSEDITAMTADDIVTDSTVTDGNQTCMSDDDREENRDCSQAKPEHTENQHNAREEAQSPSWNDQMNNEQNGQLRQQNDQQLPQLQKSGEHLQHQLKQTLLLKLLQQKQSEQQQPIRPDALKDNKAFLKKQVHVPQTGIFSKYFAAVKDHSLSGDFPYLPKNGAILEVKDVDKAVAGKEPMTFSPFYRLPNSSTTVRLWIRFTSIRKLNVQLLIFDLDEQCAKDTVCFTVSGEIKDFPSQGYNWFFHGSKRIVDYSGPYVNVHASVCLQTSKGLYDNVSIGVLKQKERYILDNSLFIRWFVKSEKLP